MGTFVLELLVTALFYSRCILSYHYFRSHPKIIFSRLVHNGNNHWTVHDDEILLTKTSHDITEPNSVSLFDRLYNTEEYDSSAMYSVSTLSLQEISEAYGFTVGYLADFASKLGCSVPVDIHSPVGDILTGEQVYTLLQALTSLDPLDTNLSYDTASMFEISEELSIPVDQLIKLCEQNEINLPLGKHSNLHKTVASQIRVLVENNYGRNIRKK